MCVLTDMSVLIGGGGKKCACSDRNVSVDGGRYRQISLWAAKSQKMTRRLIINYKLRLVPLALITSINLLLLIYILPCDSVTSTLYCMSVLFSVSLA